MMGLRGATDPDRVAGTDDAAPNHHAHRPAQPHDRAVGVTPDELLQQSQGETVDLATGIAETGHHHDVVDRFVAEGVSRRSMDGDDMSIHFTSPTQQPDVATIVQANSR